MTKRICGSCENPLDEHGCCWTCEAIMDSQRYSNLYRCVSKGCEVLDSRLTVTDGDEDWVRLKCSWCGETFKVDLDHGDPYEGYPDPTHEDDQRMIDRVHLEKYGEY